MKTDQLNNHKSQLYLKILCYAAVYIVWGSTYLFIRIAVHTIPPFYVIGLRFFGGGVFFLLLAWILGRFKRFPTFKEISASVFLGIFLLLGGNGLVTFAEKKVDSYIAALIIATTPVVVAFFDWVLNGKKISILGLSGIVLGVCGVTVLLYNGQSISMSFTPEVLLILGGLISWAFATSLGHKIKVFPDVFVNSGIQMTVVGGGCLFILLFHKPVLSQIIPTITTSSFLGLLYLMLIGSAAFSAYNYLIHHEPAIRVVSYAFVNPVIATFLGIFIAREKVMPFLVPGIILILFGLFLMLYGDILIGKTLLKKKLIDSSKTEKQCY
ncbi:MAG: EamA family transporter [Fibrobacter sp.]|nr:EamA family transporter [Fibrobacter sp.]